MGRGLHFDDPNAQRIVVLVRAPGDISHLYQATRRRCLYSSSISAFLAIAITESTRVSASISFVLTRLALASSYEDVDNYLHAILNFFRRPLRETVVQARG